MEKQYKKKKNWKEWTYKQ